MSDSINRQEAINAVRKCNVKEVTPAYMLIDKTETMMELMMLPSAEPDPEWRKKHYKMAHNQGYVDACKDYENFLERKKGKWIAYGDIPKTCSCCHEDWNKYVYGDVLWYSDELPNYCPNCGADMRRGEQK